MTWEAKEGSKIAILMDAMRGMQQERPIWSQDQAGKAMSVPRSMVPNYVAGACNAGAMHRRVVHNGIELSLSAFPAPTLAGAAATAPTTAASMEVPRFIPAQMRPPRPGSEHPRVLASTPRPAPFGVHVQGTGPQEAAADAQVVATAPEVTNPQPEPEISPQPDPSPSGEEVTNSAPTPEISPETAAAPSGAGAAQADETPLEGAEAQVEEEPELPDAWISCRTGAIVLTGVETGEDGSVTLMPDLVAKIKQRLAWSPLP